MLIKSVKSVRFGLANKVGIKSRMPMIEGGKRTRRAQFFPEDIFKINQVYGRIKAKNVNIKEKRNIAEK